MAATALADRFFNRLRNMLGDCGKKLRVS